ncbi:Mis12-Mtw1 family protein [Ascosphaera apis ARSEF 7405]|uniref:Mis12-Mtw1 family protein n=1 Tax=Ascosphaera apis ARSEF 7405 TaxID=392613 RepID=A0A167YPM1_9EURO|nr:Mis12-Mtw1 family protein [Ascosphaera apis ARSEF 7405]
MTTVLQRSLRSSTDSLGSLDHYHGHFDIPATLLQNVELGMPATRGKGGGKKKTKTQPQTELAPSSDGFSSDIRSKSKSKSKASTTKKGKGKTKRKAADYEDEDDGFTFSRAVPQSQSQPAKKAKSSAAVVEGQGEEYDIPRSSEAGNMPPPKKPAAKRGRPPKKASSSTTTATVELPERPANGRTLRRHSREAAQSESQQREPQPEQPSEPSRTTKSTSTSTKRTSRKRTASPTQMPQQPPSRIPQPPSLSSSRSKQQQSIRSSSPRYPQQQQQQPQQQQQQHTPTYQYMNNVSIEPTPQKIALPFADTPVMRKNKEMRMKNNKKAASAARRYPREESLNTVGLGLLLFRASLGRRRIHEGKALLDCGATDNFVDERVLTHFRATKVIPDRVPIRLPQNHILYATGRAKFPVQLGTFRFDLTALIVPNLGYDVILGRPWFVKSMPDIDWRTGDVSLVAPSTQRKHTLHAAPPGAPEIALSTIAGIELISPSQVDPLPHDEVRTEEFYKHIEGEGLPEPRRMRQLLTWCAMRAIVQAHAVDVAEDEKGAVLAARIIEDEIIKEFSIRSELSDWFGREDSTDAASSTVTRRPNPKNEQNSEKIRELEAQIEKLRREKEMLRTLMSQVPSIPEVYTPKKEDNDGESEKEIYTPSVSRVDTSLLDPVQQQIVASLSLPLPSSTTKPPDESTTDAEPSTTSTTSTSTSTAIENIDTSISAITARLSRLTTSLLPTIDSFAQGIHNIELYRSVADDTAGKILGVCARKLEARDRARKAAARRKAGGGNEEDDEGDLGEDIDGEGRRDDVVAVLGALSRLERLS